ncbi:cytochrome-c peroxidase [Halocola ammonii]
MMLQPWSRFSIFIFGAALLWGCEGEVSKESYELEIPAGFPEPTIPEDNQLTSERVELGKHLFYDKRLSANNAISCASCHKQQLAFADSKPLSMGHNGREGFRNSPTLANVAYQETFMMDGGVSTLALQSLAPIHDEEEMGFNINEVVIKLNADSELKKKSKEAYGRDSLDAWVITRALASFQRILISGNSRYDQFEHQGRSYVLTKEEKRGMKLFFSEKTQCGSCHAGFNFSDGNFHNIGLYEKYEDPGRERISNKSEDYGKFKTPTLRNIELTAPYMHDGSLSTLEEVIEHFNNGGSNHKNQDSRVKPLNLSDEEQSELIAFLKTLTDEEFVTNRDFRLN